MRSDVLTQPVAALGALPRAAFQTALPLAPAPVRHVLRAGRRAGVAAHRVAWHAVLAALVLLALASAGLLRGLRRPDKWGGR